MKKYIHVLSIVTLVILTACSTTQEEQSYTIEKASARTTVLDADAQSKLTPNGVLAELKEGNKRYVNGTSTQMDYPSQIPQLTDGQFPKAVIISCIDSRVPVENVFDKGVGDVFVARVAGNFVNEDILGSTEYGTAVAGAKTVVILGHENCGAVKAAIDDVQLGNITAMLSKIKPSVEMTTTNGDRTSSNSQFVANVVENNVRFSLDEMRSKSSIITELEKNGDIVLAGAVYDLDTGKVTFIN